MSLKARLTLRGCLSLLRRLRNSSVRVGRASKRDNVLAFRRDKKGEKNATAARTKVRGNMIDGTEPDNSAHRLHSVLIVFKRSKKANKSNCI